VDSLDSLSFFRFCPPIILWVCSFVFNQFKKYPFLSRSDLCYYTALLYFWARRASCFVLCASSSCSLLLLLPLPLFLIFNMGSFSLTTLLGLPSVCLSRLLRLFPAEGRERERNIPTDSLLRSWSQDGKRRCDSYACTRERELLYVGYGCGRSVTVVLLILRNPPLLYFRGSLLS
jgi:hypothetical protein